MGTPPRTAEMLSENKTRRRSTFRKPFVYRY